MRWQIQGTDSLTGQAVELLLEEADASAAIRTAHERQIVVEKIGRRRGHIGWIAGPAGWLLFIAVSGVAGYLYVENTAEHARVQEAIVEQARFAQALASAEHLTAQLRQSGQLASADSDKARQLAQELANARNRVSLSEQQLTMANIVRESAERAASRVPGLETQLATTVARATTAENRAKDAESINSRLGMELILKNRRVQQLQIAVDAPDPALARADALEKSNRQLKGEIETLKNELLVLAVQASSQPAVSDPATTEPVAPATHQRALAIPYDAARDFVLLNIDHQTLASRPAEESIITLGMKAESAFILQFTHDAARERVYSADLILSLAPDAPKDKLAENAKLLAEFLHQFAPTLKDPGNLPTTAATTLTNQNPTRRLQFLGTDTTLTIHNDGTGAYTFHIEPISTH